MSNFKKLSIVIVNYQSEAYLQKCLTALYAINLKIDFEIVIVNNDEKEKLDKIKESFPLLNLIQAPQNKGFGAACNLGVKNSQGDLLFFLNPDTEVLDELNPIIKVFEKNPEVGAIGPKLLREDGGDQEWSTGVEISLWDLSRNNLGLPRSKEIWESKTVRETAWISGAALFTPRKTFLELSGFDEKFFMYFEDADFCLRIRQLGKKIIYFPQVTICHLGGKSLENRDKQKDYFFASQTYYFQKHFGNLQVFWLKLLRRIFLKR